MAFLSGYTNRWPVTVDATKVPSTQTNFPVFVDLSDMPASFWAVVANAGGDIRVTRSDGETECAREVVSCDTGTDTGELHFLGNSVDGTTDTVFYIYANGTSSDYATTDTYGRNAVWGDYALVYHLEETSGTTVENSTGGTDGTYVSTLPDAVTGQIENGQDMNGTSDYINSNITYSPQTGGVQMWVDPDFNKGTTNRWFAGYIGGTPDHRLNIQSFTDGNSYMGIIIAGNNYRPAISAAYPTGLFKLDVVWDIPNTTLQIGYNNTSVGTASPTGTFEDNGKILVFGAARNANNSVSNFFDGIQDEIRLPNFYPSVNWRTTEYNNQSAPGTFYAVGDEETDGGGTTFRNFIGFARL